MKEIKIITKGRPSLECLPKNEAKVFYSTLLLCAIEFHGNCEPDKGLYKEKV